MKRITINGQEFACPWVDEMRPHTERERCNLYDDILTLGQIVVPVPVYTSPVFGRSLIDGLTRSTIGEELGLPIPLQDLADTVTDDWAKERAWALNRNRRHLTLDEQESRRNERLAKVAELAREGATTREVAEECGVSETQARRDLAEVERRNRSEDESKPKRVKIDQQVLSCAERLVAAAEKLIANVPRLALLKRIAEGYGVPYDEQRQTWPALDAVLATLRDIAQASASA